MKLWTIQHQSAWEKAEATGILKADGRRIEPDFRPAYRWLIEQMRQRLPDYRDNYPVWAWAQPKPDLRRPWHLRTGTLGVRIEFAADPDQVLLSHFDAWHAVLNDWYLSTSEADDDRHWQALQDNKNNPAELRILRAELEASWERVFDLELLASNKDWWGESEIVQATLGHVCLDQVVKIDYFTAR